MSAVFWYPYVQAIAPLYGVPPELVVAIIHVESRGNPSAISSAGAVGLMQVMPQEAGKMFVDRPQRAWLLDPCINICVGCTILKRLISYYDDIWRAVGAYYAGIGNVPKTGEIKHDGARKYIGLVRDAFVSIYTPYVLLSWCVQDMKSISPALNAMANSDMEGKDGRK